MRDLFLACLAALVVWSLFKFAVERTLLWYALRRMGPPPIPSGGGSLRDEDTFVEGWRACEGCKRLVPEPDTDHILHHYTWNEEGRWPECGRSTEARRESA